MKFISNARNGEPVESGTIFKATVGGVRIVIYKIIHLEGWYLDCYNLGIDKRKLKAESLMDAIEESKEILRAVVARLEKAVEIFSNDPIEISKY